MMTTADPLRIPSFTLRLQLFLHRVSTAIRFRHGLRAVLRSCGRLCEDCRTHPVSEVRQSQAVKEAGQNWRTTNMQM